MHGQAHLGEDLRWIVIGPVKAQPTCHLDDDPQVLPSLARRLDGLARQLHHSIGIGEAAGFFWKGRRWQDDISEVGGLGRENILHDQHLKAGERCARMMQVGIRHRRVLAHDVHAPDSTGCCSVHDFDHGQTGLAVDRHAPEILDQTGRVGLVDTMVVGQHHWNQTGIGCTLHVVLAAQRMQAGAGASDLAGDQRQCNQAPGVVGAVHML